MTASTFSIDHPMSVTVSLFADSLPSHLFDMELRGYRYWEDPPGDRNRMASYYVIGRCRAGLNYLRESSSDSVFAVLGELRFELKISDAPDVPTAGKFDFGFPKPWLSVFELPAKESNSIESMTREDLKERGSLCSELEMRSADLPSFEDALRQFIDWQPIGRRMPVADVSVRERVGEKLQDWWTVTFPSAQSEQLNQIFHPDDKQCTGSHPANYGSIGDRKIWVMTGRNVLRASEFGIDIDFCGEKSSETEADAIDDNDDRWDRFFWRPDSADDDE